MNLLEDSPGGKLCVSIAVLLLLATSFTVVSLARPTYAASAGAGVVIPLYNYPDSTWTTVAQTAAANPNVPIIAVVNPDSGPGSAEDPNYLEGIKSLQSAGVTVLGYIATGYATSSYSSLSNIESQVNQYKSWYGVNGIFFDEMSNDASYVSYYSTLNSYVKSEGMTYTMGNPGASVPDSYIGVFNNLCIYEDSGYPSLSYITYAGYPSSDFSLVAYGVSYNSAFVTSAAALVGYMYLDNQSGTNPYSTLSSLFAQTVSTLALLNPPVGSTTTTTSDPPVSSTTTTATSTTSSSKASTSTTTTATDPSGIALSAAQSTSATVSTSPYQVTISSFNAGTGANRLLVVGVSANDEDASSVTFGGTPMTLATSSFNNNDAQLWYLVNPSGTANVVVTLAGSTSAVVGAYALSGVNQANPVPTVATGYSTSSSSPSVSITTKYAGSWVLDLPSIWGGSTLGSPSCTQRWDVNVSGAITGASSSVATSSPGKVTCAWSASPADLWDDVAVEVQAAATTTTSTASSTTTSTTTATSTTTSTSTTKTTSTTTSTSTTKTTSTTATSTVTSTTTSSTSQKATTSMLTIVSKNTSGATITGLYTVLYSGTGAQLSTAYTPASYTLTNGQTLRILVDSYGSCQFANWQDNGNTDSLRTITINSNTQLVAVYDCSG